ncbi:hypothetical protein, partial [Endozoicomonas sp. YOMI1]|uniref:hypothetical protein n=1 Tax=Endozoicomonas sp. YOMI1 TaxID=2828739 RepID=UPI0021482D69
AECCLNGLTLNGQRVTPDTVVQDYQAANSTLELGRFKATCCLKGLVLNGQQVTPDAVVKDYQAARATLEIARFKAECCLRGLMWNGLKVTPDAVVKDFPDNPEGKLGIARFKEKCCLAGLVLNDQQVTPDAVVKDFTDSSEGKLALARFKAECCLRGLTLSGQRVTTDEVVKEYQAAKATLELARFKEQCFLRGLMLNGRQVVPDEVVKDYERGGWLLEKAVFYSQLALNACVLNGNYLDDNEVLAAFDEVPGDHSLRQAEYLMQRLKQPQWYDDSNDAQDIIQQAWHISNGVLVKDEHHRLQCILKFMAMKNELTIDHQRVSAEQLLQSIKTLRRSFHNSRLQFFFLAHCYITSQSVNGRQIQKDQVLACLQRFPEGSKMRHALGCWFEQYSFEANIMDQLLFKRERGVGSDSLYGYAASASQHVASVTLGAEYPQEKFTDISWSDCLLIDGNRHSANRVNNPGHGHKYHLPDVIPVIENSGLSAKSVEVSVACSGKEGSLPCHTVECWNETSKTGGPGFPDKTVPRLNALTLKTLEIIQEVNDAYTYPPFLITGSCSRFLQDLCPVFNDIDIICTTEESASKLFAKLQELNTDRDSEIPKNIVIWPVQGCQAIKLPNAYNIDLKDGDLGIKAMGLQVSVDARVTDAARLAIPVSGVERPVWCLPFTEEIRLLNDTLEYFAENLDPLTEQLQKGAALYIPRTILFNFPQTPDERIYGLLMRSLLTLNKARQFIALYSQGKPEKSDCWTKQLQEEQHRLQTLSENLKMKLHNHVCRNDFEQRVNAWFPTAQYVNDYQINSKEFAKALLAMMHPE